MSRLAAANFDDRRCMALVVDVQAIQQSWDRHFDLIGTGRFGLLQFWIIIVIDGKRSQSYLVAISADTGRRTRSPVSYNIQHRRP